LLSLDGAKELRISSTNGVLNVTTYNVDLIDRVVHNVSLKYLGVDDNAMNDQWTGTGAQYLTGDGLASSFGSTLNTNIFHASGNPDTLMWVPGGNYQRTVFKFGEIPASEALYLWLKAPPTPTRIDQNTDGDGYANRLDIDSDNDGITDNVEAQATARYIAPTGNGIIADANHNGLDDVYEVAPGTVGFNANGIGLAPVNTDGDANPDYLDTDSDNDGVLDIAERGDGQATSITSTTDSDGDGLYNIFESGSTLDGFDVNDQNLDPTGNTFNLAGVPALNADGSNAVPLTTDLYFRDVNNLPVDGNESVTVTEDVTWTVTDGSSGDLMNNATDLDGDTLTITGYTIVGITGTQPVGSSVTIPGVGSITINANGSYQFVPLANYVGPVPVITYTVSDGKGGTDTSTLTLTMAAVNDAPVNSLPGSGWTTNEDTSVQLTGMSIADVDVASGTMSFKLSVSSGTLTATTDGVVTVSGSGMSTLTLAGTLSQINAFLAGASAPIYHPVANANGAVTLTVTTSDLGNTGSGGTLTDVDTATITINPVNDPPVDGNETANVTEDTPLIVNDGAVGDLLNNATDVDGDTLSITGFTIAGITGTQSVGTPVTITGVGDITINANGSYSFTPALNFTGTVPVITYTVSDGHSGTDTSTLTLTMVAVNDPPVAIDDSFTTDQNTAINGNVTPGTVGQDYDVDGTFTVTKINGATYTPGTQITLASGALLTMNANGTFTYDSNGKFDSLGSGQQGTDTF
ncbi:MAG TPA: Ig-like domain-containing protein, partial [Hyphomicrobiaceae bacterium]|nr:Ig-like domain-containing protein [Hyphomicrobiaceae bacterium]